MINERTALYRQLSHWFDRSLHGMYRWSEVEHREPEKVVIERDHRGRRINQRSLGQFVEKVVIVFDGYTLELLSPNEIERGPGEPPAPALKLYDGKPQPENLVVQGANHSKTWDEITMLLRRNMEEGKTNGRSQAG